MATRGAYGFYKGGVTKITYNHSDSYPENLGVKVAFFAKAIPMKDLNEVFDRIILVDGDAKPSADQLAEVDLINPYPMKSEINWYRALGFAAEELKYYVKGLRYMIDNQEFIKDSLMCEWAYVINLDDETLEVYKGFQTEAQENRYYDSKLVDDKSEKYKNCRLLTAIPIEEAHRIEEILAENGWYGDEEVE